MLALSVGLQDRICPDPPSHTSSSFYLLLGGSPDPEHSFRQWYETLCLVGLKWSNNPACNSSKHARSAMFFELRTLRSPRVCSIGAGEPVCRQGIPNPIVIQYLVAKTEAAEARERQPKAHIIQAMSTQQAELRSTSRCPALGVSSIEFGRTNSAKVR